MSLWNHSLLYSKLSPLPIFYHSYGHMNGCKHGSNRDKNTNRQIHAVHVWDLGGRRDARWKWKCPESDGSGTCRGVLGPPLGIQQGGGR